MDGKMKGMIMAGMMALSLVLGIMAVLGSTWLEMDGPTEDGDVMEGMSTTSGLNNIYITMDLTKYFDGVAEGECDAMIKEIDDGTDESEYECKDDDTLVMTMSISDMCDAAQSDDDTCAAATAGLMGTIGMWGGVVLALVATLMMVLPMAGVDAMDAIPEMGQKVISWGAGGLMLLGMVLWYFMLPEGDSTAGMSVWIAGAAMSIALGSTLIGQFIPTDE